MLLQQIRECLSLRNRELEHHLDLAVAEDADVRRVRRGGKAVSRSRAWPFDGWSVPPNCSVVAEVYPALRSRSFPIAGRTTDQQDAFATAEWLRRADADDSLEKFFCPELQLEDRRTAEIEGWILGVA
jgi:hypothetical protein